MSTLSADHHLVTKLTVLAMRQNMTVRWSATHLNGVNTAADRMSRRRKLALLTDRFVEPVHDVIIFSTCANQNLPRAACMSCTMRCCYHYHQIPLDGCILH